MFLVCSSSQYSVKLITDRCTNISAQMDIPNIHIRKHVDFEQVMFEVLIPIAQLAYRSIIDDC